MLCAVTMIGCVDRLALSVAAPVIRQEFGFTNEQYGFLTFGFLATCAIGQLLLGPVIDRLGSKRSLSLAVLWWGIASCLHAFARGVGGFFAARAFLGFTEAVNLPAAYKVVAEWFPRAERSMASGFITAGIGIGAIVAPPLIALLIDAFDALHARGLSPTRGWQAAFIVPGLLGLAWVWAWQRHFQVKSASLFAVPADLFPRTAVATVWGASGAAGSLAAAFSQPVIGWTIDQYSYEPVFVAVALMHVVSALCIMVLVRRIEPEALKPIQPPGPGL